MDARVVLRMGLAAAAALAALAPAEARAQFREVGGYPYLRTTAPGSDKCLAWNTREIVFIKDAAGSARTPGTTELAAVDAAFATWQAVSDSCSDMKFVSGGLVANAPVGYLKDGPNEN